MCLLCVCIDLQFVINPSGAETRILRVNLALAPWVTRTSVTMVLTMLDEQVLVFRKEKIQLPVFFHYWEIIGTGNIFSISWNDFSTTRVNGFISFIAALFVLLYAIVTAYSMVYAARELHLAMLTNIFRSPMEFFDTTPIGRILNRFSRDVETIDNLLPQLFRSWFNTMFTVFSTIFVISFSTPWFLAVVLPLGLLYYFIQVEYIP